ncbi:MAG: hypothetical protein CMJ18_08825 [Phycisphaeraceae bacterium]|nr:hypothetical protein [Phycisphaeraceae bacterium]
MRPSPTHLIACLTALAVSAIAQPSQQRLTAEKLFDPTHVMDVRIELPKADWDELRQQGRAFASALGKTPPERPYSYYKGTVIIDGVRVENVGIRKKGFIGSLDETRPSLKVKFAEYVDQSPIDGLDRLTLNNNKQDRSQSSQFLSYRMYTACGVHAPRCGFAKVTVNGHNLGIYSHVESIKAPFLKRRFGDDSGHLIEGTVADFYVDRLGKFEPKTPTSKTAILADLAKVLAEDEVDMKALAKLVDIDAFTRFWATESLICFWDGYNLNQNNFYVYRSPKNRKLYFIPWGTDCAFEGAMPLPPYRIKPKSVHGNALLSHRLFANATARANYKKTFEGLLAKQFNEKKLLAELDRIEALLEDSLHESQDDFHKHLAKLRRFIKGRRDGLEGELADWPVKLKAQPRQPIYFKKIGTAAGSFSTTWREKAPSDPLTNGKTDLKLTVDGEVVAFKQIGVSAERSTWPRPGERGPKPPNLVFTGTRKSDGKIVVVAFGCPIRHFHPTEGKPTKAEGIMFVGRMGFLNFKAMRMLSGTIHFAAAGFKPDAPVSGTFKLTIVKMVGSW